MELALIVLGFGPGFAAAAVLVARRARRRETVASLRSAPSQASTTDPYRGHATAPPTPALATVLEAASKLEPRVTPKGFSLARGEHVVTVRIADPDRVPIEAIELADSGHDTLVFELALALVPLYGPLIVTEAMWGAFLVDGKKPAPALQDERGERIRAMARGIQERLAASQPAWDQLRDKIGGAE